MAHPLRDDNVAMLAGAILPPLSRHSMLAITSEHIHKLFACLFMVCTV